MTPRQRWLAIFSGESADRVPVDYWATPEVHARLKRELNCCDDETLWRRLAIDRPRFVAPRALREHHPNDPQADLWGIRHRSISYGPGVYNEVDHRPLAHVTRTDEIDRFRWPSVEDFDYSPITQFLHADDGYRAIGGGTYEPFLLYCAMRGLEQAFEDLALNEDIVEAGLARIFDFHHEHLRRIFETGRGRIDFFYLAEDLGGQTAPLMSLAMYRRFLLPNQKRIADLARSFGVHCFYHTDGAARVFLPDLIDQVGIEILNPIQWRCPGMEREGLVGDFGHRIAFHGAMDNQQTLPFGTPIDVAREVRENIAIFRNARWICAPCHNLQAVTPTANILALYETIAEQRG
jgi:uroporphyrinogen decarboxylase